MEENKSIIDLDEAKQSLESTQKAATDIGERVKEVTYINIMNSRFFTIAVIHIYCM